jgi:SAM-dependent methyltransferase
MFFADPAAAFANLARALAPGARLVQLVWQDHNRQEWASVIHQALGLTSGSASPAFSLADPATVRALLSGSGFADVELTEIDEPVWYGADPESALAATLSLYEPTVGLAGLDEAQRASAIERLRAALADRTGPDGVWFGARAWLVAARRN